MRIGGRLSALAVGLFLGALPALAADVAGKWTSEFDSQVGPQKYTYELKVDGEKVTGKGRSRATRSRSPGTWASSRRSRSWPGA